MKERLLDENNDIFLDENGHVSRASSYVERIKQNIGHMIRTTAGECFVDANQGVPWFDGILSESVLALDAVKETIREKIELVPGVKSCTKIEMKAEGRNISGKYYIQLDDETTANGEF